MVEMTAVGYLKHRLLTEAVYLRQSRQCEVIVIVAFLR